MQWRSRTPKSTRTLGKSLESAVSVEAHKLRVRLTIKRTRGYRGPKFPLDRKVVRRCNRFVAIADALRSACAQIIESTKHDRFGWTNFCTRGYESALLSIVTKCALKCATCVWQRLRSAIDYTKRARHHAIAAPVANIVLHKDGANLRPHDRSGRTGFKTTGFLAVFANVG